MNALPDKTAFAAALTDEEIDAVRADFNQYVAERNLSVAQAAKSIGMAEGTLSPWRLGQYTGNNGKYALLVKRWLDAERDALTRAGHLVERPKFQRTRTATKIASILDYTQMAGDMALIGCGPGTSKTTTCEQYRHDRPRVFIATMSKSSRGVNTSLAAILEALGEKTGGTPLKLNRRICDRFAEPGGLLIIDETQHLQQDAIEEIRSIHDRTGAGVAFVGDLNVFKLFDQARNDAFGQLQSRIGMRMRLPRPLPEDVAMLAAAWDVTAKAEIDLLKQVAARPGGLRAVTKLMMAATRVARMDKAERGIVQLRDAWEVLGGGIEL